MLAQSASRRPKRAPSRLAQARYLGDPTADVLVAKLLRSPSAKIDEAFAALCRGDARAIERLPENVRRFLESEALPSSVDRARLIAAQRFAHKHAVAIATALFCAALPAAFTGAKGVAVLYNTGRLHEDMDRRVNETGRFVFDVLTPKSFESGRAVLSIQCVRLMHAAVRVRVSQSAAGSHAAGSQTAEREVPINQEDLLGTLACFSVVVLDAMRKMGVEVTPTEAEDFFYLWRTVGLLLGIRPSLLPRDVASAERQRDRIFARQGVSSRDGRELAAILVAGIEQHLPARGGNVLAPSLIRLFLGDASASILGVRDALRPSDLERLLPAAGTWLGRAGRGLLGAALPSLGRTALEAMIAIKLGGADPSFFRPLEAARCPVRGGSPKASCPFRG